MARITGRLSAVQVAKTKGPAVLNDGDGLLLRISGTGSRSWVLRYQLEGKRRDMGLGSFPEVSLAEARDKATELRRQHRVAKVDPIEAREVERRAARLATARGRTFRQVAEEHIGRHEAGWRNAKHRQQWKNTLETYVFPELGDLPVDAIATGDVVRVLEPIWSTKPETASRVRGRIEAILDAAIAHGYRQGPNPAQWKGNLAHVLPARSKVRRVRHHAALPVDETAAFMGELNNRPGVAARAFAYLVLTACRTGEVIGASWAEIDVEGRTWTVPANRMKGGREHRVPLADAALDLLQAVKPFALRTDGTIDPAAPVFPGHRRGLPLSNMALLVLLRRMKRTDITAHGFRSTFRDWAAERTAFPNHVVEQALAHAISNGVEAAYRRGDLFDKRRELMDTWASFCTAGPVAPASLRNARRHST